MDKWTGLALVAFVIFAFGSMAIKSIAKSQAKIEMAKAGLEECPMAENYRISIWVKDCNKYKESEKK